MEICKKIIKKAITVLNLKIIRKETTEFYIAEKLWGLD